MPAKAIQAYLGPSSFKVTMDIYRHLYDDASDAVTDAMGAAFATPALEATNVRSIRA